MLTPRHPCTAKAFGTAQRHKDCHAIGTAEGKRRKQPAALPEAEEALSEQVGGENEALKQCKQEYVEEEHAGLQLGLLQTISAVHAVAQCIICLGTMKEASTVSGCGHTFCRGCIVEAAALSAVRANSCCPRVCKQPAWNYDSGVSQARERLSLHDSVSGCH